MVGSDNYIHFGVLLYVRVAFLALFRRKPQVSKSGCAAHSEAEADPSYFHTRISQGNGTEPQRRMAAVLPVSAEARCNRRGAETKRIFQQVAAALKRV